MKHPLLAIFLGILTLPSWGETVFTGSSGILSLEGEWTFYKDTLLTPQELPKAGVGTKIPVPMIWKYPGQHPSYGYGTYVAKVVYPGLLQPVIHMPLIGSASKIFVNGNFLREVGKVSSKPGESVPAWLPGLLWLPVSETGVWDILIQVSNFDDISGGINGAPAIGEARLMTDLNRRQLIQEMFFFGALFLISLYHLGLFLFRMKDSSPFWFGLIALVLSTRILVDNNLILFQLYPELPWLWLIRWNYLTLAFSVGLFPQFMDAIFPDQSWKPSLRIIQVLAGLYALIILLFPSGVFSSLLSTFHLILLAGGAHIFVVLFRALKSKAPGSQVFLAGFLFFFITVVHDVAKIYILTPIPPLVPTGLLVFLLFQALVMARKFTAAFTAAENFGVYLKRINVSLERFIPREVLSYLKKDSIMDISLGDHTEMEMTVLFADIRNFTGLSEKMTPTENFRFINSYLNRMGPIIRRHGGFVDKYLGDGIMALFPGKATQAIEAALDMRQELVRYNEDREKAGYPGIRIGIGMHTGMLMVGTIGEEGRMDSTVISDAVNLAARMEGLTKVMGEDILVSEATVLSVPETGRSRFRFLGKETVKGKSAEIGVYGV